MLPSCFVGYVEQTILFFVLFFVFFCTPKQSWWQNSFCVSVKRAGWTGSTSRPWTPSTMTISKANICHLTAHLTECIVGFVQQTDHRIVHSMHCSHQFSLISVGRVHHRNIMMWIYTVCMFKMHFSYFSQAYQLFVVAAQVQYVCSASLQHLSSSVSGIVYLQWWTTRGR